MKDDNNLVICLTNTIKKGIQISLSVFQEGRGKHWPIAMAGTPAEGWFTKMICYELLPNFSVTLDTVRMAHNVLV